MATLPPISLSDQSMKVVTPTVTTRTGAAVNPPPPPPGGPAFVMPTWAWVLVVGVPGGLILYLVWPKLKGLFRA